MKIQELRIEERIIGQWYVPEDGSITFSPLWIEKICERVDVDIKDVFWVEHEA